MKNNYLFPLIQSGGGYSQVRAQDGEGVCRMTDKEQTSLTNAYVVRGAAFAFKTGEIWSMDTAMLDTNKRLSMAHIENYFTDALTRYTGFLNELGIEMPYHWQAGLLGIRGYRLYYPPPPGKQWAYEGRNVCAADYVVKEGEVEFEEPARKALEPFFKSVFDECGVERPDYMNQ